MLLEGSTHFCFCLRGEEERRVEALGSWRMKDMVFMLTAFHEIYGMPVPSSLLFTNDLLMDNNTTLHLSADKDCSRKNSAYNFTAIFIFQS